MFKKTRKGSTKASTLAHLRQRNANDDDNDDEGKEEDNARSLILGQKRKRKAGSNHHKRGMDASLLLVSNQRQEQKEGSAESTSINSKSTNPETFSSTQEGILQQKHQQAMERYIQEKMGLVSSEDNQKDENKQKKLASEQDLYLELAKTAQELAGKLHPSSSNVAVVASIDNDEQGASVLVAGTGIAEVILPVEERLKTIQETARATRDKQIGKNVPDHHVLPMRATQNEATVIPNRFAVPSTAIQQQQQQQQQHPDEIKAIVFAKDKSRGVEQVVEHVVDADRVGFAATRRGGLQSTASTMNNSLRNRNYATASDDRTFQKFVAKQHRKGK